MKTIYIVILSVFFIISCNYKDENEGIKQQKYKMANNTDTGMMIIESEAFENGKVIPKKYTADGEDISPPLKWSNIPKGVESYVLICDDPDAPSGIWVHWVIYDIPASVTSLKEGIPSIELIPGIGKQGINDFGKIGYNGPAPPRGKPHRYFFKLYALDRMLNLPISITKSDVVKAMEKHIIAEAVLIGIYGR